MKAIENIFWFFLWIQFVSSIWEKLEVQIYGAVQVREVDTIIFIIWMLGCVLAYMKGRLDQRGVSPLWFRQQTDGNGFSHTKDGDA